VSVGDKLSDAALALGQRRGGEIGLEAMGDQGSAFEWRRKRDRVDKALEIVEHAPQTLFARRGLVTIPQKRKVYETGIRGRAVILEAPGEHSRSGIQENVGRFQVRVELPDRPPYEASMTQSYSFGYEAEALSEGAMVECRVDPGNHKRILLIAPEPNHPIDQEVRALEAPQRVSAAATVTAGKPAVGLVKSAGPSDIPAPAGSDGQIWQITMQLRSELERKPWEVTIYQRVPTGAEPLLSPGSELKVGYARRKSDRDVAIDWPGSSGGRFS
jgi:hypothetical protein